MIHIGKNTRSTIISKGISAGRGQNSLSWFSAEFIRSAEDARNYTQCDSLLMGDQCGAHTFPYIEVKNPTAQVEHEATTSKISEDQLFYCRQRGLSAEDAVSMIVNGFCKQVFKELPMEFAVEAQNYWSEFRRFHRMKYKGILRCGPLYPPAHIPVFDRKWDRKLKK